MKNNNSTLRNQNNSHPNQSSLKSKLDEATDKAKYDLTYGFGDIWKYPLGKTVLIGGGIFTLLFVGKYFLREFRLFRNEVKHIIT